MDCFGMQQKTLYVVKMVVKFDAVLARSYIKGFSVWHD